MPEFSSLSKDKRLERMKEEIPNLLNELKFAVKLERRFVKKMQNYYMQGKNMINRRT